MISRKNQLRKLKGFLLLGVCFLCFACEQPLYEKYQQIQHAVWEKDKEYFFTFEIADVSVPYNVILEVRNNNLYPYQNLWLFTKEEYPDGTFKRDTTEYMLADDYGKWYGQGFSVYQMSFPLYSNFYFSQEGEYTIAFNQAMRQDKLKGVQEIGIRVEVAQ